MLMENINKLNIEKAFYIAIENQKKNNLVTAKKIYIKIIQIEPNLIMAQYNLGLVYRQLGESKKSIECFTKVIEINPTIVNAHNNLGLVYADLGRYEEAVNCYLEALNHDINHKKTNQNLISILTYHRSNKKNSIININNELREIFKKLKNKNLNNFFSESFILIKKIQKEIFEIDYQETQIYRRNSFNLDCSRHHGVFNKFNIIPKFCFSCFKIQIEPRNIIDLIKLYIIFDSFKFSNNNWRKCMIELRPEVKGTYKGFIYCSSFDEAKKIISEIDPILNKNLKYKLSIKRGCSEFYKTFPDYKQIDKKESNYMNFDEKWSKIEKKFDQEASLIKKKLSDSISGFSISDFLIINHWLNYAKIINDTSYKSLSIDFIHSKLIDEKMSGQIDLRRKEFLC